MYSVARPLLGSLLRFPHARRPFVVAKHALPSLPFASFHPVHTHHACTFHTFFFLRVHTYPLHHKDTHRTIFFRSPHASHPHLVSHSALLWLVSASRYIHTYISSTSNADGHTVQYIRFVFPSLNTYIHIVARLSSLERPSRCLYPFGTIADLYCIVHEDNIKFNDCSPDMTRGTHYRGHWAAIPTGFGS
ncbi:hypothetical protein C8R45DRAFT_87526 [Mycena sanguinolenta]|nr:hypothetical protein C8R45DRAFT_87526 [Mycena sanguinolenta]